MPPGGIAGRPATQTASRSVRAVEYLTAFAAGDLERAFSRTHGNPRSHMEGPKLTQGAEYHIAKNLSTGRASKVVDGLESAFFWPFLQGRYDHRPGKNARVEVGTDELRLARESQSTGGAASMRAACAAVCYAGEPQTETRPLS